MRLQNIDTKNPFLNIKIICRSNISNMNKLLQAAVFFKFGDEINFKQYFGVIYFLEAICMFIIFSIFILSNICGAFQLEHRLHIL